MSMVLCADANAGTNKEQGQLLQALRSWGVKGGQPDRWECVEGVVPDGRQDGVEQQRQLGGVGGEVGLDVLESPPLGAEPQEQRRQQAPYQRQNGGLLGHREGRDGSCQASAHQLRADKLSVMYPASDVSTGWNNMWSSQRACKTDTGIAVGNTTNSKSQQQSCG